jgi:hypothetical protein
MLQVAVRELARPLARDAYEGLRGVDIRPLEAALVLEAGKSLSNLCSFCKVERRLHDVIIIIRRGVPVWDVVIEKSLHVRLARRRLPLVRRMVLEELVAARALRAHSGPLSLRHFEKLRSGDLN